MADYLRSTRSAYYAIVAALPLLLAYELLLLLARGTQAGWQVRNAGDVWLRMLLASLDIQPSHATPVMIVALLLTIPLARRRETPLRATYLLLGLGEAFAYSLGLGLLIKIILEFVFSAIPAAILSRALVPAMALGQALPPLTSFGQALPPLTSFGQALPPLAMPLLALDAGTAQGLALALGAGLFEEFIFRVLLLGGLLLLARLILPQALASLVAIVLAALLFAAAHYVGPLADTYSFASFLFRFVAGLLFTGLYYLRGFGVAAYCHAFYDIRVILF